MTALARLTFKGWFRRTWLVDTGAFVHTVAYNGWGPGYETVLVDDVVAVRRTGLGGMTHGFRFFLDECCTVTLAVAVPWWCEFLPLRDLSFARIEVDGEAVYEEGRAPKRPLKWTVATRPFTVIPLQPRGPTSGG